MTPLKAGELILLTAGDYSSFGVVDVVRVLRDFDIYATYKTYRAAIRPKRTPTYLAWLVASGYIESVHRRDVHLEAEWL